MSLKTIGMEEIGTVTVRPEAVNGGVTGCVFVQAGDTVCLLGTLVTVEDIQPIGDPLAPEAYKMTVSLAL